MSQERLKSSFAGDSANLDLIRAVAVLCVFGAHLVDRIYTIYGRQALVEDTTWHFGQMGVLIFFVHTSLVLMLSLERQEAHRESLFRDFYIRRAFRIYPLSIFCVTLVYAMSRNFDSADASITQWHWPVYLSNVTLSFNLFYLEPMIRTLWTLPLEVQMYLVLPVLYIFGRSRPLWILLSVWVLAVGVGIAQPHISGRLNVLQYAPCFVAGVIGWRLSRSASRSIVGWTWPLAFVALWFLFLVGPRANEFYFRCAFCLALGMAIPLFGEMQLGILNRIAHAIAKYSYGIYLSHSALIGIAFWAPVHWLGHLAILVLGITAVPFLMFHLIEQPMIQLGRRLVARQRTPALASAPVVAQ